MQELKVDRILYNDKGDVTGLLIVRSLTIPEKVINIYRYFRGLTWKQRYIRKAKAIMNVDINYIESNGIKFNTDINRLDDIKYAIQVIETTDEKYIEDEGITKRVKINPYTNKECKHKGKLIYRYTEIITAEEYTGDKLLQNDK